jgi:hypothetical protein
MTGFKGMLSVSDQVIEGLRLHPEGAKFSLDETKARLELIEFLTWDIIDRACAILNPGNDEELTREEIDFLAIAALDRLGYHYNMFDEVAAFIESAIPIDGLSMTEPLTERLASWRSHRPGKVSENEPVERLEAKIDPVVIPPAIESAKPKKASGKPKGDRRAPGSQKAPVKKAAKKPLPDEEADSSNVVELTQPSKAKVAKAA